MDNTQVLESILEELRRQTVILEFLATREVLGIDWGEVFSDESVQIVLSQALESWRNKPNG